MSDIAPISRFNPTPPSGGGRITPSPSPVATASRGDDKVELSRAAQLLSKLAELPDIRHDLVSRVKNEIAQGTYETDDKVETAITNLQEDLG